MIKPFTILSTKSLNDKAREMAVSNSAEIIEHNFIYTVPLLDATKAKELQQPDVYFVFTSSKAVKYLVELAGNYLGNFSLDNKVFCLEGDTLSAVEKAGFKVLASAKNSMELAKTIAEIKPDKLLLFFCSSIRRDELPAFLKSRSIDVKEIVLYNTILKPICVQQEYDVVFFYSPSGVASFFMSNKLRPAVSCICIGETTATALREHTNRNIVIVADKTTQEDMVMKAIHQVRKTQLKNLN